MTQVVTVMVRVIDVDDKGVGVIASEDGFLLDDRGEGITVFALDKAPKACPRCKMVGADSNCPDCKGSNVVVPDEPELKSIDWRMIQVHKSRGIEATKEIRNA